MRIRRSLGLSLTAIVLTMAACGEQDIVAQAPSLPDRGSAGEMLPESIMAEGDYRVGISFPMIEIPFFVNVSYGAVEECIRLGIECLTTFGGGYDRPEVQVQDVEDLLAQGVDAILVCTASDEILTPAIEEALAAGVVVTSFCGDIATIDDYYGYQGVSHYDRGMLSAEASLDCMRERGLEEGELIVVGGPRGAAYYIAMEEAYEDLFGREENSGFVVVYHQYTATETREEALRVTEDALTRHPNPDIILPVAPEPAQGVIQALQGRGFAPGDVCIGATGGWDRASAVAVSEGWYYKFVIQQSVLTGQQNIRKIAAHLNGEEVPFYIAEEMLVVSPDDIDELDQEPLLAPADYTPLPHVEPRD